MSDNFSGMHILQVGGSHFKNMVGIDAETIGYPSLGAMSILFLCQPILINPRL